MICTQLLHRPVYCSSCLGNLLIEWLFQYCRCRIWIQSESMLLRFGIWRGGRWREVGFLAWQCTSNPGVDIPRPLESMKTVAAAWHCFQKSYLGIRWNSINWETKAVVKNARGGAERSKCHLMLANLIWLASFSTFLGLDLILKITISARVESDGSQVQLAKRCPCTPKRRARHIKLDKISKLCLFSLRMPPSLGNCLQISSSGSRSGVGNHVIEQIAGPSCPNDSSWADPTWCNDTRQWTKRTGAESSHFLKFGWSFPRCLNGVWQSLHERAISSRRHWRHIRLGSCPQVFFPAALRIFPKRQGLDLSEGSEFLSPVFGMMPKRDVLEKDSWPVEALQSYCSQKPPGLSPRCRRWWGGCPHCFSWQHLLQLTFGKQAHKDVLCQSLELLGWGFDSLWFTKVALMIAWSHFVGPLCLENSEPLPSHKTAALLWALHCKGSVQPGIRHIKQDWVVKILSTVTKHGTQTCLGGPISGIIGI